MSDPIRGREVAGRVEAVGQNVVGFRPGDEVFGSIGSGGFAEYVCAREKFFALKPANLSLAEAAAAPVVGFTALQGLRDTGQIQAGQKVHEEMVLALATGMADKSLRADLENLITACRWAVTHDDGDSAAGARAGVRRAI